jgi:signal peptidase I
MKRILFVVWEIGEVLFIALIAVAAIKYFLIQPFIVNGASMEPTFFDGDYLLVDELSYRFHEPARGDVVVFKAPQDTSLYYIKRIVGLPDEKIEVENDTVRIFNTQHPQGVALDENYIPHGIRRDWAGHVTVVLGEGQYFVLGDNRLNSLDSRYWGPLEEGDIVGLVKIRLWPVSEVQLFGNLVAPSR